MPPETLLASTSRRRTRSVGFLDHEGATWACFLVTYRAAARTWRGHLVFRRGDDEAEGPAVRSVRTADIFVEAGESEIDRKARQLGRPLLRALLSSSLEVDETARQEALGDPGVRVWVHEALREHASNVESACVPPAGHGDGATERSPATDSSEVSRQRSRYEAYRIAQMAHLVSLMEPDALDRLVEEVLRGERFAFGAKDRLQFAMMVVQRLEALLPLPPLEVFLKDYHRHPLIYDRYHHDLYAGGELP